MERYKIADLHCHSILKSFGHSFSCSPKDGYNKSHLWYHQPPDVFKKLVNSLTGLTTFRQSDFTALVKGGVRIAVVSLYPLEKGFFFGGFRKGPVWATVANLVTGVSYKRIRHLQDHTDYYRDLVNEYTFLKNSCKNFEVDGKKYSWRFAGSWPEIKNILKIDNCIAVVLTIEGAHVFNTGLQPYGKACNENEVLGNINRIKQWNYPPFFITFAHNFNNDLCGHTRSLARLGKMANQLENLDKGFSRLGLRALHALLSSDNGRPIYIDIKHMSLSARKMYYQLIDSDYHGKVPIIVSHGAVTGLGMTGEQHVSHDKSIFCTDDINFFDEELVSIAKSGGVFALQLDASRLVSRQHSRKPLRTILNGKGLADSSFTIWMQLQHVAEVLDRHGLFSWGTVTIGSDFDGGINPLNGIWTAENLPDLAHHLLVHANRYLKNTNRLKLPENKTITAEEIVERFVFSNAMQLFKKYYR
jgi:microsomal dipeptidase-like Zn-dependent dipeptidase